MRSKKLKFEGGVPDGGQGQNQHVNLGLPFDIKAGMLEKLHYHFRCQKTT